MLVIDAARAALARLPWIARVGLGLMVAGAVLAVATALGTPPHPGHGGHAPDAHAGHLVAFVGMLVTLAGVVGDGAGRQRGPRHADNDNDDQGGSTHATR